MKRCLLPAVSLLLLIVFYLSCFHAAVYVPSAQALSRAGVRQSQAVALTKADGLRLRYGAPKDMPIRLRVLMPRGARVVTVRAEQRVPDAAPALRWVLMLSAAFSLLLTAYLGARRPTMMIAALIFYVAGGIDVFWLAPVLSPLPDPVFVTVASIAWVLLTVFPNAVLASFAIRFPGTGSQLQWQTPIRIIDGIVAAAFLAELIRAPQSLPEAGGAAYLIAYMSVSAATVIAASVLSLLHAQRADRGRVALVFAAVMLGGVGYAVATIAGILSNFASDALLWYIAFSVVIIPLAVAYAIIRHRIFDIAFVLNRTVVYGFTSAFVVLAVGALEFLAERFLNAMTHVESLAIELAIALVVVVCARAVHRRVDVMVDTVVFRTRHEQESGLRRFATTAHFYSSETALVRDTLDALEHFGNVHGAAVYLASDGPLQCAGSTFQFEPTAIDQDDPAYVELRAHRTAVDIRNARCAFLGVRLYPMVLAAQVTGVIALGERESGEAMPPDIDEALSRVADAVAIALAAIETKRVRDENAALRAQVARGPEAAVGKAAPCI